MLSIMYNKESLIMVIIDKAAWQIDGACAIDNNDWVFEMSINGQYTNNELQDVFLEYVELLEDER